MIDRQALRYFLAVVDHGNFSKAAALCNVAQPTLSVGIAKLERELGRTLFHRTNRRVALTEAGARFVVHARKVEAQFAEAERSVLEAGMPVTVRLGILTTIPTTWHEALVRALQPYAATDRVEFVEARERDILEQLARGRTDMALTLIRHDDSRFASETMVTEGYGVAMSLEHPLAQERTVRAEALADNVMIVRRHCEALGETSRHFVARGVRPFFGAKTSNDDRALALVRSGLGVTVMPMSFADGDIAMPRLCGFNAARTIGILLAPHADVARMRSSPTYQAVAEAVRELGGAVAMNRSMPG